MIGIPRDCSTLAGFGLWVDILTTHGSTFQYGDFYLANSDYLKGDAFHISGWYITTDSHIMDILSEYRLELRLVGLPDLIEVYNCNFQSHACVKQ